MKDDCKPLSTKRKLPISKDDLPIMYHRQQNKCCPERCSLAHLEATLSFSRMLYVIMFFAFWLRKLPEFYFLAQAFANLHGKRRQGFLVFVYAIPLYPTTMLSCANKFATAKPKAKHLSGYHLFCC